VWGCGSDSYGLGTRSVAYCLKTVMKLLMYVSLVERFLLPDCYKSYAYIKTTYG
jgi:hypothetical protein